MTREDEDEIRLAIEYHTPVQQSDLKLLVAALDSARAWARRWKSYAQSRDIVHRALDAMNDGAIEDNETLSEKIRDMGERLAVAMANAEAAEKRGAGWALAAVSGKLTSVTNAGRCIDDALNLTVDDICREGRRQR